MMIKVEDNLASSTQTFEHIIEGKALYVDKTAYLAEMISSGTGTWFFTRPRRFGKSLTVSTLNAVFSGRKELFEGLAIEKRLNEEPFAPRPVIHLDMSDVTTFKGSKVFEESLGRLTARIAKRLGVEVPLNLNSSEILSTLIRKSARKSGHRVAILVDEYDTPLLDFLRSKPEELEAVGNVFINYFRQLKSCEPYISFIFITGITKLGLTNSYSSFNTYNDISNDVKFGAMAGFTQAEFEKYFERHIKVTAQSLKITEKKLLEDFQEYYDGFCFDGETEVYCPFSTLRFFFDKEFYNYWFNTGPPYDMARFMKDNFLTVDDFRGISISKNTVACPNSLNLKDPKTFLYQAGYLSLRKSQVKGEFLLDYANREVREAMAQLVLDEIFESQIWSYSSTRRLLKALSHRDPAGVVYEINILLSKITYEAFERAKHNNQTEQAYQATLISYFRGADLDFKAEDHGSIGLSDLGFILKSQTKVLVNWVITIKVCREGEVDQTVAQAAFDRIIEKKYAAGLDDPVILGVAISDQKRTIKAWKSQGGSQTENESEPEARPRATKAARKPKAKGGST